MPMILLLSVIKNWCVSLVVSCIGFFASLVGCLCNMKVFMFGFLVLVGLGIVNLHLLCLIHFLSINYFAYSKKK
jgi:hypothetical protein